MENYVFHYTGKLNQSYVMKREDGSVVFEAICEKITLFRPTPYRFVDHARGGEEVRMISHTVTRSVGDEGLSAAVSSFFKVDGEKVWSVISRQGYGYAARLRGITIRYDVTRNGQPAGTIEAAGTGVVNPKYKDSKLGQLPANGIYRISCAEEDTAGFFLLCFAFAKTQLAMKQLRLNSPGAGE